MAGISSLIGAKGPEARHPGLLKEVLGMSVRELSRKEQQKKIGKMAAVLGALTVVLNVADNALGWNQIADLTIIPGGAVLAAGAYFALRK